MGLAVAATVRVGIRRREGQRSDRPAHVCRRRARPRLAARSERVRRAGVSRRLGRGDGRPAPGSGPGEDGRGPRPGPRRSASARQPGLPRRHRSADATRLGGVTDGPLGARPAGAPAGSVAGAGPGAGDRAGRSPHGRSGGAPTAERRRTGPAGRGDRRAHRAHRGLARGPVPRRAVDQGAGAQGQGRGDVLRERPARVRLPAGRSCSRTCPRTIFVSSHGPPFSSGCPGRSATRSSSRAARRRFSSRWRAPTCSSCRWTPTGSGTATTISSRSCCVRSWPEPSRISNSRCSLVQPNGARRTGSRRRPSATRRRPATSTGWHGWSSVALIPPTRAAASRPSERWLDWLEQHGALERNAAVAVLGALIATVQGRPAAGGAFRRRGRTRSYDGTLPDGSPSIDSLAVHSCVPSVVAGGWRECARMRSLRSGRSPVGAASARMPWLLLAVSHWLAGEVDQADDLFADVVEEGLELGAHEAAAVALGERAAVAIGRGAMGRGGGVRRASASGHPPFAAGGVPHQRVRLCAGGPGRAPPRRSPARPRAPRTGATPAAGAHLRDAAPRRPDPPGARPRLPDDRRRRRRRDDAARDRRAVAPTAGPRHASLRGGGAALRA